MNTETDTINEHFTLCEAAPDLLAALELAKNQLEERASQMYGGGFEGTWYACPCCSAMDGTPHEEYCDLNNALKAARAAIAKAKGDK